LQHKSQKTISLQKQNYSIVLKIPLLTIKLSRKHNKDTEKAEKHKTSRRHNRGKTKANWNASKARNPKNPKRIRGWYMGRRKEHGWVTDISTHPWERRKTGFGFGFCWLATLIYF